MKRKRNASNNSRNRFSVNNDERERFNSYNRQKDAQIRNALFKRGPLTNDNMQLAYPGDKFFNAKSDAFMLEKNDPHLFKRYRYNLFEDEPPMPNKKPVKVNNRVNSRVSASAQFVLPRNKPQSNYQTNSTTMRDNPLPPVQLSKLSQKRASMRLVQPNVSNRRSNNGNSICQTAGQDPHALR